MNLLIIGAGKMGVRHCIGAMGVTQIKHIFIVDINPKALESAQEQLNSLDPLNKELHFCTSQEIQQNKIDCQIAIIASTVKNRIGTCQLALSMGCTHFLIEKPLGQSKSEVDQFVTFANETKTNMCINLNMRLYDSFIQLKKDINTLPQLAGNKVITVNTGTIGIGSNGIHYLDLLFFLLDASKSELVYGQVEENRIVSGRGEEFEDYGGWCTVKFYNTEDSYLGRAHLSLTSGSSVFGGWDIIGPHGHIRINEVEQSRIDILRDPTSSLPVYRYAGDYMPPKSTKFVSPFLGDLTKKWIQSIINGNPTLPSITESVKTHYLLFEWLSLNCDKKQSFSIT